MKFDDILLTASSGLLRSKMRTLLTIVAIFIGALTITLTNGIGTGVKGYLNEQLGNFGATNVLFITLQGPSTKSSDGPAKYKYDPNASISAGGMGETQLMMNSRDLAIIRAVKGISDVEAAHSPAPDYIVGKGGSKYQLALSQQYGVTTAAMVAGTGVNDTSATYQLSVPESYVKPLGYSSKQAVVGQVVTLGITDANGVQSTLTATVAGVQQKSLLGQAAVYGNTALVNRLNDIQNVGIPAALADTFQTAYATFPSGLSATRVDAIKDRLSDEGFSAKTIKDEEDTVFTAVDAVIVILDMFGVIALLAASFGIINTLYMSVQERTKEIGLMKALGMGRRRIFVLFSVEAVLIGFWGSLLGVGAAELIGAVVNAIGKHGFLKDFPGLSLVTFPARTIVVVMAAIMLIAFLAGTLPALRAARKDPIEALRYE